MAQPVVMSWSGGKDSALALQALLDDPDVEVVALLTTVADPVRRISHHGVREELLQMQADAIGLPLDRVTLTSTEEAPATNAHFEERWAGALAPYLERGIREVAHGDLFLEDLRDYRERHLAALGMRGRYPLWQRDTSELIREFVARGFRAVLCAVDERLGAAFAGRTIDADFLGDLPEGVDPCGENGEYHSFVFDGPLFREPVDVAVGEVVRRDVRWFADLVPARQP